MGNSMSRRGFVGAAGAAAAGVAAGFAGVAVTRSGRVALAQESAGDGARVWAATEPSMKGDIAVFTTIKDGAIVAVDVLDDVDTDGIRQTAVADVPARIVDQQNVEVDATAGATMTSLAIKAGVSDALDAAGLDAADFRRGSDAVATQDKAAGPDEEFDVVVVGAGMAGLSCAVNVGRATKDADGQPTFKVLVLEKNAYVGGSFRVCGGGIWAMGSGANQLAGQDCSARDYIQFMSDWSEPTQVNRDLLQNIHDISGETFDYLYDWGFPVRIGGWTLGNPQAQLPCFWSTAAVGSDWETGESGVADFMATRAEQDGAEIRTGSAVTGLLVSDGAVTGVQVEDAGRVYRVSAKKVVLTCGGFTRNTQLIDTYAPDYADAFAFTGAGSTGDGITMTADLGAQVVGEGMMGLFGVNPALGYYGPIGNLVWQTPVTVNAQGETFGMEGAFYGRTLRLLLDQTDACGYGIADGTAPVADRFESAVESGYATSYETLDDLASDMGIDTDALKATCQEGGLSTPPFYCIVKRPLFIGSIPGLKVSADCEVLGVDDEPIENLYAAGELIFGNIFDNAYPCSGTGVGTSCYTGAIAARACLDTL